MRSTVDAILSGVNAALLVVLVGGLWVGAGCSGGVEGRSQADEAPTLWFDGSAGDLPSCPAETASPVVDTNGNGVDDMAYGQTYAGQWNDLEHWGFWRRLLAGEVAGREAWSNHADAWQLDLSERYPVRVLDPGGQPVVGATVELVDGTEEVLWEGRTDAAGRAELYANLDGEAPAESPTVIASKQGAEVRGAAGSPGDRRETLELPITRPDSKLVDVVFLLDNTSSMDEQSPGLQVDIDGAIEQLAERFGQEYTFSYNYQGFRDGQGGTFHPFSPEPAKLGPLADPTGGGDYPEGITAAMDRATRALNWHDDAEMKIMVLITDAPNRSDGATIDKIPHLIEEMSTMGIRVVTVAGTGIDERGEYLLRALSMTTGGRFIYTMRSEPYLPSREPAVGRLDVDCLDGVFYEAMSELLASE